MGDQIAISLKNVSKCFKCYDRPIDRLKEILLPGKSRGKEFWALNNINLEINRGETLGIVGRNGSGKSTLLQIIVGTLTPTFGEVNVNGRISALLELGSGFNPEFTGRENIFFNGKILGLSKAEIEAKFDEIASFADIGEFIEQPVKTYSSGMFVRLAFAVAINVDPDILIVDEALAVGDIFFQQKCYSILENLQSKGKLIVFVSHDSQAVSRLCSRSILLENGKFIASGTPKEIIDQYTQSHYSQFLPKLEINHESTVKKIPLNIENKNLNLPEIISPEKFNYEFQGVNRYGAMVGLIEGIAITDSSGKPKSVFQVGESLLLSIKIGQHSAQICPLNIGFQIKNSIGQIVIGTNTCFLSANLKELEYGHPLVVQFAIPLSLFPQEYTINVAIAENKKNAEIIYDWIDNVAAISMSYEQFEQIGLYWPQVSFNANYALELTHY